MPNHLSYIIQSLIRVMAILSVTVLAACASNQSITAAISAYQQQAEKVSLGQSKEEVLALLQPTHTAFVDSSGGDIVGTAIDTCAVT